MQTTTPSRHRILHDENNGEPQHIKWYERFHLIIPGKVLLDENNEKNIIVEDLWGARVWERRKKDDEFMNTFSLRKSIHSTGVGADPYEAYERALDKIKERRKKRGAQIIIQTSGYCFRNGANFYYTLDSEVLKIKNPSQ